jgi:HlyD family secretion protein/macrolide-specific efflux system membrane fusion protein
VSGARKGKGRRWRAWSIWILVLLVAGSGTAFALRPKKGEKIDRALLVTAQRAPLAVEVVDVGKVEAFEQVDIQSKVAGRVAEVLVQEGQHVEVGQLLLLLDQRDFRRVVARETAALAASQARAGFSQRGLERKTALAGEGLSTRLELEQAEREARLAEIDIDSARVALTVANDRLRDTRIVAPAAGTVIRRKIEPGEMVVPGVESVFEKRALLTIANLSRLIVKVELNQVDMSKVRVGQRVTATFDGLAGETFPARVTEVSPASNRPPGKDLDVFPIKAELDKPDPRVKPGMVSDVRIHVDEKPNVIAVPIEALRREAGKTFVKRVVERGEEMRTEQVEVVLGTQNDRSAEIVSGLSDGDKVLLDPPSSAKNETAM